jgi:BCCT family betaine/carnitine transporter
MPADGLPKANHNIDWFIFTGTAIIIPAVCVPLILYPEEGAAVVSASFDFVTTYFGFAYVWSAVAAIGLLAWLAMGRHGSVRLGPADSRPEFSTFSWAAMLFCGGIGTTVLYWGTIEWAYYYQTPPYGELPGSPAAIRWAISYPIFHWGITGWVFYCLPAVGMAYAYHVGGIPSLKLSSACRAAIGTRSDGPLGRLIDLTLMVGLVGAAGTGVGFSAPLITASVSGFTGISESLTMTLLAVALGTVVFAVSVYAGLERGIKRLSNINAVMALLLLVFVLVAGPTLFILKAGTDAIGFQFQNFIRMNTWTEPLSDSGFVESWTIFYWAWWIALGPFMGVFVSKISRGRTIREMIFGVVGYGTLGCTLFFCVLGNYALHLELEGLVPVIDILNERGAPAAIVGVLTALPTGPWLLPVFALLGLIFLATTYDSASYTLASVATKELPPDSHPARWHRVFWALSLGILPTALLILGGLRSLQTAVVVVSLPLIVVGVLMSVSLVRSLRAAEAEESG